jgi:putative transposase
VGFLVKEYKQPIVNACKDMQISRSCYYYESSTNVDPIEEELLLLANDNPKYGCRKLYQLLRLRGIIVNHKKVSRLYKLHQLHLRVKQSKRLIAMEKHPLVEPDSELHTWCCDFVHDKLHSGGKIKALTVVDEFNREAITVHVESRINSTKLLQILNYLKDKYGLPKFMRSDNGREFTALKVQQWAAVNGIQWMFIQPGKPTQNAYCERFNGTYRHEVLDSYLFTSLSEARLITNCWVDKYNHERPHDSLDGLTPIKYKEKYGANLSTLICA